MLRGWICVCVLLTVTLVYTTLYLKQSLHMTVTLGGNDYETDSSCYRRNMEELRLLVQEDENRFQRVDEAGLTYVYSAYLDDRKTSDVHRTWLPVVRIFSWFSRTENVTGRWRCVFWGDRLSQPLERAVVGWTDLNTFDTSSRVVSAMILCPLPHRNLTSVGGLSTENSSSSSSSSSSRVAAMAPFAVSLVTSSCRQPRNMVRVVDLRRNSNTHLGGGDSSEYVANFSVCVPPIFGNFDDVSDLVEFIETNRVLGAQKFQFYTESVGTQVASCLREYVRRGIVDVQPWTLPSDIAAVIFYHGQILAISECLYRLMYRTRYLVVQDIDEFIVPMNTDSWQSMLNRIVENGHFDSDRIASYNFRNRFFPVKSREAVNDNFTSGNGIVRQLKTLSVTTADKYLFPFTVRSKVMARPERVLMWHVHLILDSSLVRRGDKNVGVDAKYGQLFHYKRGISVANTMTVSRMKLLEPLILRRLNVATAAICLTGDYIFS